MDKRLVAYYYNITTNTFFVDKLNYKPSIDIEILRVGVTLYPSVNGLMNRVFKRYRRKRLEHYIVKSAMNILEYDNEFEIFINHENK